MRASQGLISRIAAGLFAGLLLAPMITGSESVRAVELLNVPADRLQYYSEVLDLTSSSPTNSLMRKLPGEQAFVPYFDGGVSAQGFGAFLVAHTKPSDPEPSTKLCDSTLACVNERNTNVTGDGQLTLCSEGQGFPCFESLEYQTASGTWKKALLTKQVDLSPSQELKDRFWDKASLVKFQEEMGWSAIPEIGLPASAPGPLLFSAPGLPNAGGTEDYMVEATYFYEAQGTSKAELRGKIRDFRLQIRPVLLDNSAGGGVLNAEVNRPGYRGITTVGFEAGHGIAFQDKLQTGWAVAFGEGAKFRVVIQVPESIGGWFWGRLANAQISSEFVSPGVSRLVIEGDPVEVQTAAAVVNLSDSVSPELKTWMQQSLGDVFWNRMQEDDRNGVTSIHGRRWLSFMGTKPMLLLKDFLGDRATGRATLWTLNNVLSFTPCMNSQTQVQGLVTTNSMAFDQWIPTFQDGFFNYKVAGLHENLDGEVFSGSYEFIMRSDVARCLYGYSKAPVSAAISVIGSNGENKVATTEVGERDGWLKLSARNFSFSENTLRVKITQPTAATLAKFNSNSRSLSSAQKSQIRKFISAATTNQVIRCTGVFGNQNQKAFAQDRAKAACAFAKSIAPSKKFVVGTKQSRLKSQSGRVMLSGS